MLYRLARVFVVKLISAHNSLTVAVTLRTVTMMLVSSPCLNTRVSSGTVGSKIIFGHDVLAEPNQQHPYISDDVS